MPRVDTAKNTGVRCLPRDETKFLDDTDCCRERTLTTRSITLFHFALVARTTHPISGRNHDGA